MRYLTTFCSLLVCTLVWSQDIHFSQFTQASLYYNPANAGFFRGDQRVVTNYKDQWRSINNAFRSYGLQFDTKFFAKGINKSYMGGGIYCFRDKAGDGVSSQTEIGLSGSYIMPLTEKTRLSAGLMGSYSNRQVNPENLQWGNQFNGNNYDPGMNNHEQFLRRSLNQFDIGMGVAYSRYDKNKTITSSDQIHYTIGAAVFHINQPQYAYTSIKDGLNWKAVIHGSGHFGIKNSSYAVLPRFLMAFQGPNHEVMVGGYMRYMLKMESKYTGFFKESAVSAGAVYRVGDAVVPGIFLEMHSFGIGFSYDINISDLTQASNSNGGMEISLRFINPNPFKYGGGTQYKFGTSSF